MEAGHRWLFVAGIQAELERQEVTVKLSAKT